MPLRYLAGVVTLELDEEKCDGCRMCAEVCPHGVFDVEGGRARIVDRDACIECGACALNCPAGAISVEAGVGCANALIRGVIRGGRAACGPPDGPACCGS